MLSVRLGIPSVLLNASPPGLRQWLILALSALTVLLPGPEPSA